MTLKQEITKTAGVVPEEVQDPTYGRTYLITYNQSSLSVFSRFEWVYIIIPNRTSLWAKSFEEGFIKVKQIL